MKALVATALVSVLVGAVAASANTGPAGQTCMSQHVEAPGVSAAALIPRP